MRVIMLRNFCVSVFVTFMFVYTESFNGNRTAELISTYAKVAHWGIPSPSDNPNEGRSNGQSFWTHRSNVNIRGGQIPKKKQPVTYYYSMREPSSKLDKTKVEPMPYKGEVQERFNPRPYFDFTFDDPPRQNQRPSPSKANGKQTSTSISKIKPPTVVYGAPPDTFASVDSFQQPPTDAYSSPFNSYNPPKFKPDDSKNQDLGIFNFPPNGNQAPPPPPLTSYGTPDDKKKQSSPPPISYGTPNDTPEPPKDPPQNLYVPNVPSIYAPPPPPSPPSDTYKPPSGNFKPPKTSNKPDSDKKPPVDNKFPSNYNFHPPLVQLPPHDTTPPKVVKKPENSYLPPLPPSDNSDSLFYLPPINGNDNGNKDQNSDADVNGKESGKENENHADIPPIYPTPGGNGGDMNDDDEKQPSDDYAPPMPMSPTTEPPPVQPPYLDHPPMNHDYQQPPADHSMAEGDLSPPPAGVPYGKIPQYLDHEPSDHDFFHYGHHDVYHEVHTTTTTTTTEAPRAGHYSYYYLGRKLWYIPLYFSVYFIVYVTVLILKSIARHKIQFTHYFDKSRESRQLDIDYVNKTVVSAIEKTKQMYM